jgi:hypothetical protein
MWSTKTTCPLRLLDFVCCLCSSPDQRSWILTDQCGHWKVPYQLTSWLFSWKSTWQVDFSDFSAEKVPYQLTSWLFSWKGTFISWQSDFSNEKVPYQLISWLFSKKGTFSADKLAFQLKTNFISWKAGFSADKVPYQQKSLLFSWKHPYFLVGFGLRALISEHERAAQ